MSEGRFFKTFFPQHPFVNLNPADFPTDDQNFLTAPHVFHELIALTKPSLIIEVGTWKGHSANEMANVCKHYDLPTKIICVDTWLGSQEHYLNEDWRASLHIESGRPTLWNRFVGNTLHWNNWDRIYPLPLPSSTASVVLAGMETTADLIYIDAGHEYNDVFNDITLFYPLLEDKGMLFGDDFHHPPLRRAVFDFANQNGLAVASKDGKWVLIKSLRIMDSLPNYTIESRGDVSDSHGSLFSDRRCLSLVSDLEKAFSPELWLRPAFAGQEFGSLAGLLQGKNVKPNLQLQLCTIDQGFLLMEPYQDGIIFTADGKPIPQTLKFRTPGSLPDLQQLRQRAAKLDFNIFTAVDAGWRNYYHWLCMAIPKMVMARHAGLPDTKIVFPDYSRHRERGLSIAFSDKVWDQSLYLSEACNDSIRLSPGIYQAPKIHTILVDHQEPALLSCFREFSSVYDPIRRRLRLNPTSPKRLLVKRRNAGRLSQEEAMTLENFAVNRGFVSLYLEDLDFIAQAEAFFNAEAVIAPHGAGLTNLVFAPPSVKILELNHVFGGESWLRPWFYILARAQAQDYVCLDGTAGQFRPELIKDAIESICSRLPSEGTKAVWWTSPTTRSNY